MQVNVIEYISQDTDKPGMLDLLNFMQEHRPDEWTLHVENGQLIAKYDPANAEKLLQQPQSSEVMNNTLDLFKEIYPDAA